MKKKIAQYGWFIFPLSILVLGYTVPLRFFDTLEEIRVFVSQFGFFAPIVFVILQVIQVLVPPISHQTISLIGGVLFGFELGVFYNWVGRVLGSTIAFLLSRKYGKLLVKRLVSKDKLLKLENVVNRGHFLILLMYLLPLFPDDEVSYILGLSGMTLNHFLPLVLVGHITGSLFAAGVGSGVLQKDAKTFLIAFLPSIILFFIISFFVKSKYKIDNER